MIKRTAHKIKSSLGLLNNKEASVLCDEIEHIHSNENLRSKISDLNLAISKLLVALNKDFSN
jgi:HPt (histidine-containing phosphotransfer) domain-containing protein